MFITLTGIENGKQQKLAVRTRSISALIVRQGTGGATENVVVLSNAKEFIVAEKVDTLHEEIRRLEATRQQ